MGTEISEILNYTVVAAFIVEFKEQLFRIGSRRSLVGSVCRLIRLKARIRAPGQTSKQNTKSISSEISSQQIAGKNYESK